MVTPMKATTNKVNVMEKGYTCGGTESIMKGNLPTVISTEQGGTSGIMGMNTAENGILTSKKDRE